MPVTVFFSYSHADRALRDLIEKHLSTLKREGTIDAWHDGRIDAGEPVDASILAHLERADIVLLLVSANFLASDYCWSMEMNRGLERHEAGDATVIPVILDHCDWHAAPFGKLRATPRDGKPIASFPNVNEACAEVVADLRRGIASRVSRDRPRPASASTPAVSPTTGETGSDPSTPGPRPRSSNLRVKKAFSDQEKFEFLQSAFDYVGRFFANSLDELGRRDDAVEGKFRQIDANQFTAAIFVRGDARAACTIRLHLGGRAMVGITYTHGLGESGYNEILIGEDDGYVQSLRAQMHMFNRGQSDGMSPEGAAEYLWSILMEGVQR